MPKLTPPRPDQVDTPFEEIEDKKKTKNELELTEENEQPVDLEPCLGSSPEQQLSIESAEIQLIIL